jgi:hypothetical protein
MSDPEDLERTADAPPAHPEPPVGGVRIAGGRQLFVRDVPPDTPAGAVVRFEYQGDALRGTVSIPPSLLMWCDPSVECGRLLALEPPVSVAAAAPPAREPVALLVAEEGAPDAATMADMLGLAYAEQHRLDDEGTYRPRHRPEPDMAQSS